MAHKRQIRAAEQARLVREILEGKASAQSRCDLNSVGLKNHMQSNSLKNNTSEQHGDSSFRRSKHSSSAEGMSSGSDGSDEDTLTVLKFESDK